MSNPWIPAPVAALWAALFVLVAVVHLYHVAVLSLRHRLWHAGHVLMAAGMVAMFLPVGALVLPADLGVVVFAAAAGLTALALIVARVRGVRLGPLWALSVADLAWMVNMFAMMHNQILWLSLLGALWFTLQALGWASGRLGQVLEHHGLGDPPPFPPTPGAPAQPSPLNKAPAERTTSAGKPASLSRATQLTTARSAARVVDGGPGDWSVRITLTVMAVGMAYMMVAMQFAMITTSAMPGM